MATKRLKLVQCWAVNRGFSGVTQGLDKDGQVWERHVELTPLAARQRGKRGVKREVTDEWWFPVSMKGKA